MSVLSRLSLLQGRQRSNPLGSKANAPTRRRRALGRSLRFEPLEDRRLLSVGGSVPTALVTVGSPSITAVYEGDTNFTSSTSANLNQAVGVADLTVSMTHSGEFRQGDKNATYTITVSNVDAATSGTVTVVNTFPTSLYPPSTNNGIVNGWTVSVSGFTVTATRGDVLAAGASYPPLTLTVQVSDGAPASVTNTVTVSGGGETNAANDTASDIATVVGVPPTVLSTWPELTDGTIAVGTTAITIYYSEYVPGGGTASNYELRSAGPDGLLGTGDDVIIPVAISFSNTVAVLTTAGLPEDVYRLTVRDTLADPAGNKLDGDNDGIAGGDWVRDFVVTANDKILIQRHDVQFRRVHSDQHGGE